MELKNDLAVRGVLETVDQYLNLKLTNATVVEQEKFPQLVRVPARARARARALPRRAQRRGSARARTVSIHPTGALPARPPARPAPPAPQLSVKTVFVRGSVVRYVHVPPAAVDTELLQDAARREAMDAAKPPAAAAGGKRA